ncbi:hypothetical protein [Umezawaea tangerina]|uniref:Putative lipoprotein with Yx(FWY)xxD motif n=1 Tax=Umezawaea tangerina TaxID=84725 RepID=A0A2T0TCI4_9PSEU|nr:hypothetical protein [Umezawaea tangerina]PRY43369.1 putative lipoprotein with Yx(FWY)xxD motif [Umezawaea tangerina]
MPRKHAWPLAVLLAVGAIALSACGTTAGTAQPASQPAPSSSDSGARGPAPQSGTARTNKADEKAGDTAAADASADTKEKWVSLRAGTAGDLDPVVINGAGLTLYRFDKDSANPPKATCNGDCAVTWPPVTVAPGGKIFFAGVKKDDIGTVKRDDGKLQVTIKGWPVYRYTKDTKPGDTLGQGVGGTWFGVTPTGEKAGSGKPAPQPASGAGAQPSTSVTLYTGKNFDDFTGANFATVVANAGCNDLRGAFFALTTAGSTKIWSEPGCKGKSAVVAEDVSDVTPLGFPNGVKSVFLG